MHRLWSYIDSKKLHEATKYRLLLIILGLLSALAGFGIWLIIRLFALSTLDWMLCFVGFPVILSWFVVFFYSCRHDFHDTGDYTHLSR